MATPANSLKGVPAGYVLVWTVCNMWKFEKIAEGEGLPGGLAGGHLHLSLVNTINHYLGGVRGVPQT